MPIQYEVQQGDCFSSIARRFGFKDYRTIYDDGANAELKKNRPDPNVLHPGDVVVIPESGGRVEPAPTDRKHRFQVKKTDTHLAIVVKENGKPLANVAYELFVEGAEMQRGMTDGGGMIRHPIPGDAIYGTLKIVEPLYEWDLFIGMLDPVTEVSGVQARLNNLGFACGDADGDFGSRTRGALRQFQARNNLTPNGKLDGATRAALKRAHDGG